MPLHIDSVQTNTVHELTYYHAGPNGTVVVAQLPIFLGRVTGLPPTVDALVCASDLQGVAPLRVAEGAPRLLGEVLADELPIVAASVGLPPIDRMGVVLAGDLYAAPEANVRGASGDVRCVWQAFRNHFRWVTGVAGNHDRFGTAEEFAAFQQHERQYYLDGEMCTVDGLAIAGIGGILGKPTKPQRRSPDDYAAVFRHVLAPQPDLLIIHESPVLPEIHGRGSLVIRQLLETNSCPLTVSGHSHWQDALAELPNGTQVLNVDSRVVILVR